MTATTIPRDALATAASAPVVRAFAMAIVVVSFVFVVNNYLIFWQGWPGLVKMYAHLGWLGPGALRTPLSDGELALGWLQIAFYLVPAAAMIVYAFMTRARTLRADAARLSAIAAFIVRAAFWTVLIVGLVDVAISFLRVEGLLPGLVGDELTIKLGQSRFRGAFIHLPLAGVATVIAVFTRTLGFSWLALLVVLAELQIVIARFVFSYEQAFMADLVRFWYAGLFLFASAYTLIEDGHVRVDVLYTGFFARGKAWTNTLGSLLLGLPLCWVIVTMGMWGKGTVINSPLRVFEISQSGFGMYVKYLMAAFLAIFALSMMVQFVATFLYGVATLRGDGGSEAAAAADPAPA